jgi:hypothetical protein
MFPLFPLHDSDEAHHQLQMEEFRPVMDKFVRDGKVVITEKEFRDLLLTVWWNGKED